MEILEIFYVIIPFLFIEGFEYIISPALEEKGQIGNILLDRTLHGTEWFLVYRKIPGLFYLFFYLSFI